MKMILPLRIKVYRQLELAITIHERFADLCNAGELDAICLSKNY